MRLGPPGWQNLTLCRQCFEDEAYTYTGVTGSYSYMEELPTRV